MKVEILVAVNLIENLRDFDSCLGVRQGGDPRKFVSARFFWVVYAGMREAPFLFVLARTKWMVLQGLSESLLWMVRAWHFPPISWGTFANSLRRIPNPIQKNPSILWYRIRYRRRPPRKNHQGETLRETHLSQKGRDGATPQGEPHALDKVRIHFHYMDRG